MLKLKWRGSCLYLFCDIIKNTLPLLFLLLVSGQGICGVKGNANSKLGKEGDKKGAQNYKDALFIYPPGIRSERDVPICSKWLGVRPTVSTIGPFEGQSDMGAGAFSMDVNGNSLRNQNPMAFQADERSRRPGDSGAQRKEVDPGPRWESACNIVHNRFFYPPIIERLCRCPDRTECPWEWSQPPNYPNAGWKGAPGDGGAGAGGNIKGSRDPFTVMLSSRSQAKFCTEVASNLPRCEKKSTEGQKTEIPSLGQSIRRMSSGKEIPSVKISCYCPPLYRQWKLTKYVEPRDFGNGTQETSFDYQCDRLGRCRSGERCGSVRTDMHFSFYHCTCPRKHLCLPKKYPVESVEDVEEDVQEVLFRGQVAPAFCTPFQ